jgi:hypothetical protein
MPGTMQGIGRHFFVPLNKKSNFKRNKPMDEVPTKQI